MLTMLLTLKNNTTTGYQGSVKIELLKSAGLLYTALAPVVQRPDNFIRWIRHYSGSKIYFTLNVAQSFRTLPNLAVVRVCIRV